METRKVLLAGGPAQLPGRDGVAEVAVLAEKIKIAFASGYEHFADSGEVSVVDGEHLPVFSWCGRTRIAE